VSFSANAVVHELKQKTAPDDMQVIQAAHPGLFGRSKQRYSHTISLQSVSIRSKKNSSP